MTSRIDRMTEGQVLSVIEHIYGGSFTSKHDGCSVVLVTCAECKCQFEEELQAAKDVIKGGTEFLCLAHDENASVPAFVGLTIQLGWFS